VDDAVLDAPRVADARKERHVALAAALEDDDPLLVGLDVERLEHEWKRQLLRATLDEQGGAREEELGAIAVELGERAERLRLRQRVGLEQRRADVGGMSDERQLLEAVDAEEH